MSVERREKSYFSLTLPRKVKSEDKIQIICRLQDKPKLFRILLGVKSLDKRSNLEPLMIAFEFKVTFPSVNKEMKVTTNWKTDENWQDEYVIEDTDWIDSKGLINIILHFDGNSINLFDNTNSLITKFDLKYEINKINRLQLWGDIIKLKSVTLRYP